LENLLTERLDLVAGKRVGLVVSPSSVDGELTGTVERLFQHPDVNLAALFGPEHGLRAKLRPEKKWTRIPTRLWAASTACTVKPRNQRRNAQDWMLVFDMGRGVRLYVPLDDAYVMQAGAEQGIPVIILIAPRRLAARSSKAAHTAYSSFVGTYPIRSGMMTNGDRQMFNEAFGIGCELHVVPMSGWKRSMWYDQTGLPFVPPSPNLPTLNSLTLYPGTCLVEGSVLSEGRGTTLPFEYIGAPWIEAEELADAMNDLALPGARFRQRISRRRSASTRVRYVRGVHIYVQDRERFRPVEMVLRLLAQVKAMYPNHFGWRDPWSPGGHYPIDLLSGGSTVREHLNASKPVSDLVNGWQESLQEFCNRRAKYPIYTD
jgi:uncharacterized protein YbbC (DUF1343 family)